MVSRIKDSTMKIRYRVAIVVSLTVPLVGIGAPTVKADGVAGLTASQLQQFSRDLIPSNSQDFFRQGREQVEREIQRLDHQTLHPNERLLKVEPQIQGGDDRSQYDWQRRSKTSITREPNS